MARCLGTAVALVCGVVISCASTEEARPRGASQGSAGGAGGSTIDLGGAAGQATDPASPCASDDGFCEWPSETCACGDCKGRVECGLATCNTDAVCTSAESCLCPDCAYLPKCEYTCAHFDFPAPDPDTEAECSATTSCACPECSEIPECMNLPPPCFLTEECACVDDGACDPSIEPCVCGGCEKASSPDGKLSCTLDVCDVDGLCSWAETCWCADCYSHPMCTEMVGACDGGAADGSCADGESCQCPDCALLGKCVTPFCLPQDACGDFEWCICPGCASMAFCGNIAYCEDDGKCGPSESCYCADCAAAPTCLQLHQSCDGAPDGVCGGTEACTCIDCLDTEPCVECVDNGVCGGIEPCICADCEQQPASLEDHCYMVHEQPLIACVDDGACHPLSESCACSDCWPSEWCSDNLSSCAGASADGACDAAEPCSCPDCWWTGKCVATTCTSDGQCGGALESLVCPDCVGTPSFDCDSNGFCHPWAEGCDCDDCADAPTCPD